MEFELRASCLQSRHFTTWATPLVHFALVILEMGISQTICPGWHWTEILPISASQEARIIGVSHQWLVPYNVLNLNIVIKGCFQISAFLCKLKNAEINNLTHYPFFYMCEYILSINFTKYKNWVKGYVYFHFYRHFKLSSIEAILTYRSAQSRQSFCLPSFFETWPHFVVQVGLELIILLPMSPQCWNYRCAPSCPPPSLCFFFFNSFILAVLRFELSTQRI
jgi:hypothetical protein